MGEKQIKILAATAFIAVAILSLLIALKNGNRDAYKIAKNDRTSEYTAGLDNLNPLEKSLIITLQAIQIPDSAIKSTFMVETETKEITVSVPKGKPMEEIIMAIQNAHKKTSYSLEDSYYSGKTDRARLLFISSRKNEEDIVLHLRRARKGYFRQNADIFLIVEGIDTTRAEIRNRFLTFEQQLTYHVNSWSEHLDSLAVLFSKYNAPYIVEIPLESKTQNRSTQYTLRIDDSEQSIEAKLSDLLRRTPSLKGISARSGDLFLETKGVTHNFFTSLEKRDILFFDRRKGSFSRAETIAKKRHATYINSNKKLSGSTSEMLSLELKKLCHTAGGRKELILWGEASEALIDALETTGDYFDKTGVTIKGIDAYNY